MKMHHPAHPGVVLRELCIQPLGLTVTESAFGLGVTRKTLSSLLNGHSGVSPEMALRLAKAFKGTPEHWLEMQLQYDLWTAKQTADLKKVRVMAA